MDRYIKSLLAVLWLYAIPTLQAQQHVNAWFRITLSIPAGKKIKIDNEFQHRRQNGFANVYPIDKNLMFTYRSWVNYQHSENMKFSVSPFAYFYHYKIIQKKADEAVQPNREIRFSAAAEFRYLMFKNLYVLDRAAIEYRTFVSGQTNITRIRNRFGFLYDFTGKVKPSIFNELLLNIAGTAHDHFFDHYRAGFNLEYKVLRNLKLDAGYMYITRLPATKTTRLSENNIFLNLTFLLGKQAKTNKDPPAG